MKRTAAILLLLILLLTGCDSARKIETASIIENVSVGRRGGELYYTFYRLSSDEKPPETVIAAESFEEACRLAKEKYIPHLSLAKLRLLLVERELKDSVMPRDIAYISTQTYFSPVAYVALCDAASLEKSGESAKALSEVEQQLLLCQKNNPQVKLSYLSIYNSLQRGGEVSIAYLNSDKEIKTDVEKIFLKQP